MLNESLRDVVADAYHQGTRSRDDGLHPDSAATWDRIGGVLRGLPKWIDADDLIGTEGHRDPRALLTRLVEDLPELEHLQGYLHQIRISFWTGTRSSRGRLLWGQARKLGPKDRALTDGLWWDLDLSLIAWCALDGHGQVRLLHHEALHLQIEVDSEGKPRPLVRGHDVEDHAATLGRFGVSGEAQEAAVANAARHPSAAGWLTQGYGEILRAAGALYPPEDAQRWEQDGRGQGLLFGAAAELVQ